MGLGCRNHVSWNLWFIDFRMMTFSLALWGVRVISDLKNGYQICMVRLIHRALPTDACIFWCIKIRPSFSGFWPFNLWLFRLVCSIRPHTEVERVVGVGFQPELQPAKVTIALFISGLSTVVNLKENTTSRTLVGRSHSLRPVRWQLSLRISQDSTSSFSIN